jgi:hypothetical protein
MQCSIQRESNLGDIPQDRRLRWGAIAFALGLVLAVVLLEVHAPATFRLLLALPFFVGATGLYQGLFRTCSGLAARGLRDNGDGPTPIADPDELARVRRTAMILTVCAMASAAMCTGLFMIV